MNETHHGTDDRGEDPQIPAREGRHAGADGAGYRGIGAVGVEMGVRSFPNLKIPYQNPRLQYFHNINFGGKTL